MNEYPEGGAKETELYRIMHGFMRENYPSVGWEDRWDMIQDVWERFVKKQDDVLYPHAYCCKSLRNQFIDNYRKRKNRPRAQLSRNNSVVPGDFTENVINTLAYQPLVSELLDHLSEREEEFLSYFWDGLRFTDEGNLARGHMPWVAEQMGCSEGAAKQILIRIRRKARDIMAGRTVNVNRSNLDLSREE